MKDELITPETYEILGYIRIPKTSNIKGFKLVTNIDGCVVTLTRENRNSPKNFTEISKVGSRNYLELALLISLSINFLTFLIFVCIYLK